MENFFIDDKFYSNVEELLEDLEIETIDEIPETYSEKAEYASLEPISKGLDIDKISEYIFDYCSDRMPEDFDEKFEDKINKAIKESFDVKKLHSLMPELWYANNQFFTITREDLISYLEIPSIKFEKDNKYNYLKDMGFWQTIPSDVKFYPVKEINNHIEFIGDGFGFTKEHQKLGLYGKYGCGSIAVLIKDIPHLADWCKENFLKI